METDEKDFKNVQSKYKAAFDNLNVELKKKMDKTMACLTSI